MAENPISSDVTLFIARYIRSIEQLEILSLLAANPGKQWSIAEMYRAIQSTEESIKNCLRDFVEQQLAIQQTEHYAFSPATPQLRDAALAVLKAYRERPVAIIELIYSPQPSAARSFADAFRLRKNK